MTTRNDQHQRQRDVSLWHYALNSEMSHGTTGMMLEQYKRVKEGQLDLQEDDPWHAGASAVCSNEVGREGTSKELKEAPL